MFRKTLAVLFSAAMAAASLQMPVFAEETEAPAPQEEVTEQTEATEEELPQEEESVAAEESSEAEPVEAPDETAAEEVPAETPEAEEIIEVQEEEPAEAAETAEEVIEEETVEEYDEKPAAHFLPYAIGYSQAWDRAHIDVFGSFHTNITLAIEVDIRDESITLEDITYDWYLLNGEESVSLDVHESSLTVTIVGSEVYQCVMNDGTDQYQEMYFTVLDEANFHEFVCGTNWSVIEEKPVFRFTPDKTSSYRLTLDGQNQVFVLKDDINLGSYTKVADSYNGQAEFEGEAGTTYYFRYTRAEGDPESVTFTLQDTDSYSYYDTEDGLYITGYGGAVSDLVIPAEIASRPVIGIDNYAFANYSYITSVTIPAGVVSIGENAFYACDNLASIVIPDSVKTIGANAFRKCTALETVALPDSVTSLGASAFDGCTSLKQANIPQGLTVIEKTLFFDCTALEEIIIPSNIEEIGDRAFAYCSNLEHVVMPASVKKMYGSFRECPKLKTLGSYNSGSNIEIEINETFPSIYAGYTDNGDGTYDFMDNMLRYVEEITLPEGVTAIAEGAFMDAINLKKITLPSTVTSIGKRTFRGCTALPEITIPAGVTTVSEETLRSCIALTTVYLPNTVTTVEKNAFDTGMRTITVHYDGSPADWSTVSVTEEGNAYLLSADMVFTEGTGLYLVNKVWKYYENGVFSAVTGVVQRPDNRKWFYVKDGTYTKATGLAQRPDNKQWYYVKNGAYTKITGLVQRIDNGKWFYVKDGVYTKATGLAQRPDNRQWYYVQNGAYTKITGLVQRIDNKKWYYVQNGVYKKVTGLVQRPDNKKWYYVANGAYTKATGLTQRVDNKKWYYVYNGVYTKWTGVTGRITDGKMFYVANGVYTKYTGTAKDAAGNTYKVTNGAAVRI